ncbi:hypothetical protein M0R45_015035 [Rubus argutus]|uniref:SAM-dependent methyltransferase TRM5/TYW2-type domain-containing protein n=1 Tax=Rubus argutus TaxID=59490 RepID=A0AAW1XNG2_RUBAR
MRKIMKGRRRIGRVSFLCWRLKKKKKEEDLRGLLGAEFQGRNKWRGSTRLLLLDERYGDKCVEELPQAIQAAMKETIAKSMRPTIELVRCKLTLFYDYWQMNEFIAKVVLDKNKPKIQTVVNKIDAIQNDYRTMQLDVLAGNHSLVTKVVENGLRFQVDLATVYWNSRLATERQRLLKSFTAMMLCVMFSLELVQ